MRVPPALIVACCVLVSATLFGASSADGRQAALVSIAGGPTGETTSTQADFAFTVTLGRGETLSRVVCELDGRTIANPCTSPVSLTGLSVGAHRFSVIAQGSRGEVIGRADTSWTVIAAPPATPPPTSTTPQTPPQPPPPPQPAQPPASTSPAQPAPTVSASTQPVTPDFFLSGAPTTLGKPVSPVELWRQKGAGSGVIGLGPSATVYVIRKGSSTGGFSYSFSKFPSGVTGFVMGQSPKTTPATLTVRLFASLAAKPGPSTITLTATPLSPAAGPGQRSIEIPVVVVEEYDLAIVGIDVTQGIQAAFVPKKNGPTWESFASYPGTSKLDVVQDKVGFKWGHLFGSAPLVQGKKTQVNVFAIVVAGGNAVTGASVVLHGRAKDGSPLPQSPLKPDNAPSLGKGEWFAGTWHVSVSALAAKPKTGAFRFTLPASWTDGTIELDARLLPPKLYGKGECTTWHCEANNRFRLKNLVFHDTGYVSVWPLGFVKKNGTALNNPEKVFKLTNAALPLDEGELRVDPYRAYYFDPGSDSTRLATVKAFVSDLPNGCSGFAIPTRPLDCPDLVAGVSAGGNGKSAAGETLFPPRPGTTVVNENRPLTSVAHETGHAIGFKHADTACGGGSGGQKAESLWPDPWGMGYGITTGGRVNGQGNVASTGSGDNASGAWYDLMSYCAPKWRPENDAWISLINYRRAFTNIRELQKLRSSSLVFHGLRAQERAILSVIGYVADDAVVVTRIRPKTGAPELGPADSPYRLLLHDGAGRTLVDAPMRVERAQGDGAELVFVSADVLLPGGTPAGLLPPALHAVEIVSAGRSRARVVRSPSAPTVELVAPVAGARVGGGPPVSVRWNARDADGDALTASIEYSDDDGATWRTLAGGVSDGRVSLPSTLFTASTRARVRVRVSDGFNETAGVVGGLVSRGAPPVVRITTPEGRIAVTSEQSVSLEARAYENGFRRLRGAALTWLDGRKRVASGEAVTLAPLAPGLHRIQVVVRDRLGRTARASVAVLVRAVAPRLIVHQAPARVSTRATVVRLVIAATAPSLVVATGPSVRGQGIRWRVGTGARAISVPVKAGTGAVRVQLRATAAGHASTLQLVIPRSG